MKEDIRGYFNRDCIYSDNGRCDMWDDFAMPEDVNNCDNYTENFNKTNYDNRRRNKVCK